MDHERVRINQSSISCGVCELSGFSSDATVEDIAFQLASYLYHPSRGKPYEFVIWSDTQGSKGEQLYDFLAVFRQGCSTDWAENSKTGNFIKVFVWNIHHSHFREWYKKQRIEKIKKQ